MSINKDQQTVVYLAERMESRKSLLEHTFKEHGAALRQFLRARLALEEDREDIIQELFEKLARADNLAQQLSTNSGNTRYYLLSITTNLIIDMQRRKQSRCEDQQDSYEDNFNTDENALPDAVVATQQQIDTIVTILKRMNPKYRRAFVLNRFRYKSYREISLHMGVSETTVERYIASALGILRRGLNR